jgi:hypothetical protein
MRSVKLPALFDRMVLVGHSMAGLLAKMMAQQSKSRLWSLLSNRLFEQLAGEPEDVKLLRQGISFEPRPEIRASSSSPRRIGAAGSMTGPLRG